MSRCYLCDHMEAGSCRDASGRGAQELATVTACVWLGVAKNLIFVAHPSEQGADYSYTRPGCKYFQLFRAHGLCLNILTQPCTTKATKRRPACQQEWLCTSATWLGRTRSLGSVPGSTPPTPALELSGFQTLATSNLCKKPTQFKFKPSLGSEATARVHTPALPGAACLHPHPRPGALLICSPSLRVSG